MNISERQIPIMRTDSLRRNWSMELYQKIHLE